MEREETVKAPDGRRLEVVIAGGDGGPVVICHGGTPGGPRMFHELLSVGAERGVRQVTYARPGYLASDRQAGRSVADCAADVEAIADHLGIDRFHTAGWSGGGPHALACAALLPDRILSAAAVSGVAPRDAEGLDWSEGMGDENVEELGLADQGADALRPWLDAQAAEIRKATAEDLHRVLGDIVSPVDRAVLTGAYAEHACTSLRAAVSTGIWGWLDDDLAHVRAWGFELDDIRVPVSIWQGGQDRFVPPSHGRWLAEHVPGARAHLLDGEGHLSLGLGHHGDILDDLLAAAG